MREKCNFYTFYNCVCILFKLGHYQSVFIKVSHAMHNSVRSIENIAFQRFQKFVEVLLSNKVVSLAHVLVNRDLNSWVGKVTTKQIKPAIYL